MTSRLKPGRKILHGVLVGLAGTLTALCLWASGLMDPFEAKTWDWRAALLAEPGAATDDIRIIFLDQNSLDWAKNENGLTWPWPREVYGAIVDYCRRSGAKALAFDVIYTEPSKYGVADDAAFGRSVADFGSFIGAVFLGEKTGSSTAWPENLNPPGFKVTGLAEWMRETKSGRMSFPRASFPIPELSEKTDVLANVQLEPDPDGVYRRTRLLGVFDGQILPSLGLGAYLAARPDARMEISPGRLTVGGLEAPIDDSTRAVLRYRGPSGTHKNYSAAAVLQSEIRILSGEAPTIADETAFRDKYVFFGFSAPGLFDLRPSPVDGVYPGVEIHATMLDNLLSGDFMRTMPAWGTVLMVIALAMSCGILMTLFSHPASSVALSAAFLSFPVLLSLVFYIKGVWLNLAVLEMASVSAIALTLVVNYATEGRQKRFIKNAFQQYLSPAVIDQLIQHPERLKLGGERRVLSIFFSDLQGFTSISESLDPESLTALLNDYLSAMTDIIIEEGGTIDKYEGDAIIAFWNAPVEAADHAVRTVRATLRCQQKLAEMRPEFKKRIGKDMLMRVGINTGPAVVGNMGSHERFDYTMLGDSVNLAARLEGVNKQFGTYTMISEYTRDMMGDAYPVRELARVAVVGKKAPVTVYEPMYPEAYNAKKEILETFSEGLALFYHGRFEAAGRIFSKIDAQDPAAASYRKKCAELNASPPDNWAGVWVMSTK